MTAPRLGVALLAEGLGTALLLAAVVGSGVMAERLAGGNMAVALLANAVATGAALVALIQSFGPLSGAHFNPIVSLGLAATGLFPRSRVAPYIAVQMVGAVLGVILAHAMFDLGLVQISQKARSGGGQWLSEAVAGFMLLTVILRGLRGGNPSSLPYGVALTVVAGYWYTASTSFANPAVTLARSLTDSFAGIRPVDVPAFMMAQGAGALASVILDRVCRRWI
ncbi:aquaporin [Niveispirillum sp. KHB5.9]|uniref:aquaporin n=1 Tax=Niveispirillum sp. KHB5.9 TaxID=3400269 RepID=UPI003A886817